MLVTLDDAVMFQVASFRSTVEAPPASVVKAPVRMDFPLRATLAVVSISARLSPVNSLAPLALTLNTVGGRATPPIGAPCVEATIRNGPATFAPPVRLTSVRPSALSAGNPSLVRLPPVRFNTFGVCPKKFSEM